MGRHSALTPAQPEEAISGGRGDARRFNRACRSNFPAYSPDQRRVFIEELARSSYGECAVRLVAPGG
jgi:hypothetical protein